MHEEWLMSILREIEDFVATNKLTGIRPLIEAGYRAAESELTLSAPTSLAASRIQRRANRVRPAKIAASPAQVVRLPTAPGQ